MPFFIAGGLLVIYAVVGVYILPAVLKSKIPEIIQQETGRKALISNIQVQPFPLSVSLQGFEIQEHNGQPFAAFDVFYIKLGLFQSIKQLALAFDEISLKKPFVHIARQKNGTFNFQDLFKGKADDKKGGRSSDSLSILQNYPYQRENWYGKMPVLPSLS